MEDFFKELFEYSHHFNQQFIQLLLAHPDKSSEKVVKLLSHVLNAHNIWNARIQKRASPYGVWDVHLPEALMVIENENYHSTLEILQTQHLATTVNYTTSGGQAFQNTVRDILFHAVNHSTYHRAQITSQWKQNGIAPILSDYIFYKR